MRIGKALVIGLLLVLPIVSVLLVSFAVPTLSGPQATPGPTRPATVAPSPTAGPFPSPTQPGRPDPTPVRCNDRAALAGDAIVPAGNTFGPGEILVKTWRLRNDGSCVWNTEYALVFAGGDRMGGPLEVTLASPVAPGEEVLLSVTLTAPDDEGLYEGHWLLRNDRGRLFGLGEDGLPLVVRIFVERPAMSPTATPLPTPFPTSTPTPTPEVGSKPWRGEYYVGCDLSGTPVLVRGEEAVDFDWGDAAPASSLPADGFSARWTGTFDFRKATYRFHILVDDGARLWVDGRLVLDTWRDGEVREVVADLPLEEGSHHLQVGFYERSGRARIHLWWEALPEPTYPDWKGMYWPVPDFRGRPDTVRNDRNIDFDWDIEAPDLGMPADEFSVRWTREIEFRDGTYRFHLKMDDGARVWLDDTLIVDEWRPGPLREVTFERDLRGKHRFRVEYVDWSGPAQVHFWWERIPSSAFPDWKGEYFSNMELRGNPRLVRNDPAIDFDWGASAAGGGLPEDKFSVRWTRWVVFEPGTYRFQALADNGIRVYLDGRLLIDGWEGGGRRPGYAVERVLAGGHEVVVEYYDNGGPAQVHFWWERVEGSRVPGR